VRGPATPARPRSAPAAPAGRVMRHEPGLRFWMRYVEREGGLVEDAGDHAIALLSPGLSKDTGLPESLTVTSNPDVAREDGAVLLIAGHPELERAASSVLEPGDVGRVHLPWPGSARPRASDLQTRARDQVEVAHGRIDATGEPRATYLPLLRVGVMISYSASLTDRFQEQDEVWVDARAALPVGDGVLRALSDGASAGSSDRPPHAPLEPDIPRAIGVAHAILERRATARRASLVAHARNALERELAQVDAYYSGALESITRRQASATEDRRRLLDDQADATRAEHARRRREIQDEFRARHEILPFRLHVVLVPAFVLPVGVRRGSRIYPFAFTWLPTAATFADARCPHCDAHSGLIAGRERLGCSDCLTPASGARSATAPLAPVATSPATD
jgi:hypothetical protein